MITYYKVSINADERSAKAKEELVCCLKAIGNVYAVETAESEANFHIELAVCDMREGDFSAVSDGNGLIVRGAGVNEVLCGVYTALEEYGVHFSVVGDELPAEVDFSRKFERYISPSVRWRGIRQHLNFPMDISSYSLNEAKRYIRALARLRYNSITFHSYPDEFYCGEYAGERSFAGKFFYGEVQPVSNIAHLKNHVSNLNYYCIEEAEQYFNDEKKLSDYALFWLRSVMEECKAYGIRIVFSFEVRNADSAEIERMTQGILSSYPQIDVIEYATQECGCGWDLSAAKSAKELRALIAELYGEETARYAEKMGCIADDLPQLPTTLQEMKKCIAAARKRTASRVLVYATCPRTLKVCRMILRENGIAHSFLCAHGAKYVAENLNGLLVPGEELPAAYGWIEFDGNMFQLQNKDGHNYDMINVLREKARGGKIPEVAFNHWRNAENALSIGYCGHLLVDADLRPRDYYARLDGVFGFDCGGIERVCEAVSRAEDCARDSLPNIGFCAVYCWYNSDTSYLGYIENYTEEKLAEYRSLLAAALERVCSLKTERESGERLRAFWQNRLRASQCHVAAIEALMPLKHMVKIGKDRSEENRNAVFAAAMRQANEYLRITARNLPDRGAQGVLVSYYKTVFHYIYVLRERLCGIPVPESYEKRTLDAPPSPMIG